MPAPFDGYVEQPARVSSTCLVTRGAQPLLACRANGPGTSVSTRLYPERDRGGGRRCRWWPSHARLIERGQTGYDWQHYVAADRAQAGRIAQRRAVLDLPEPLQRLRQACFAKLAATG